MPEELKGDRTYHETLRRLGVKNPGEVRIQTPVVMSAKVDDLTEIHAPLANNLYHAYPTIGANAGQRSGFYLVSQGCWLKLMLPYAQHTYWTEDATPPALLNLAEVIPRLLGGEAALANQRTRVYVARDVVGNWPTAATWQISFFPAAALQAQWVSIYLPPGRVFYSIYTADNNAHAGLVWWTEVPPAPPGG